MINIYPSTAGQLQNEHTFPAMEGAVIAGACFAYHKSAIVDTADGHPVSLVSTHLVVVGFEAYANEKYHLGTDDTINIPLSIDKIETSFAVTAKNIIECQLNPVAGKDLRIIMRQFYKNGDPFRSWPGAPPDGKNVSEVIIIKASQDGKELPLHIEYDKMIWSGLSWGVGELKHETFDPTKPVSIQCLSKENDALKLTADVYAVVYA